MSFVVASSRYDQDEELLKVKKKVREVLEKDEEVWKKDLS